MNGLVGQPADLAPSAYQYRCDRAPDANPPESWILMIQAAGLPYEKPVDVTAPAVRSTLCGLLWEEVRPIRRVELSWPAESTKLPGPDDVAVSYFESGDDTAHTWWNPRAVKSAGPPEVAADGRTYAYEIPGDTWGVVASVRHGVASDYDAPTIRAFGTEAWKRIAVEIEWGFEPSRSTADYGGRLAAYDAIVGAISALPGDTSTEVTGAATWQSRSAAPRRGIRLDVHYIGTSRWRRVWPYSARPEDVARSILTVETRSGSFSFNVADLEMGPICAPEYGFFVRAESEPEVGAASAAAPAEGLGEALSEPPLDLQSSARTAKEFLAELAAKHLRSIRSRTREHADQTWDQAVAAMCGPGPQPPIPTPGFAPAMTIDTPDEHINAQWALGAWHLLSHTTQDAAGKRTFNDFPFGILASETYLILRALDLQGMHKEAADGLDQWLSLPMQPIATPGENGHHKWALPDRPLGHFSDGRGCFTHAVGVEGWGGHMDGVHAMGPGAIVLTMSEHYRLTGDLDWLKKNIARIKANAEWILRQRRLLAGIVPGGEHLWSAGLQPAQVVTPDSMRMHMQFYEAEAYYWLAVKLTAEMLKLVDPSEGERMAAEAEEYRKALLAAVNRSITLTPVVPTRDGTYHSFIPFAPYVRGPAAGAWGWRRCQGHVGAIYWDTAQSAAPLISPAGLLDPSDPRVQGFLDVLEDRLLLENSKVNARTPGYEADRDWLAHAGWQYQCGLERTANIHLMADDAPNFIRSMMNQYAVDIMPGDYTFREHTTGGPPDKSFEEASFLERLRGMLVTEVGDTLWLARATPRQWLEQGKRIAVKNAPTHFGELSYSITSDVANGSISATIQVPAREPAKVVVLRLRHPRSAPIKSVTVNGRAWTQFDAKSETVSLTGIAGLVEVRVRY
jgi:hypothetical protein